MQDCTVSARIKPPCLFSHPLQVKIDLLASKATSWSQREWLAGFHDVLVVFAHPSLGPELIRSVKVPVGKASS